MSSSQNTVTPPGMGKRKKADGPALKDWVLELDCESQMEEMT